MTTTKQPEMLEALQAAWDARKVHRRSKAKDFYEAAVAANADLGTGYDMAWFAENEAYLVGLLSHQKQEKLREAIELLMGEVNSSDGDRAFIEHTLGHQHRYLVNEFVGMVMLAIQKGSLQDEGRNYIASGEPFGYTVRQAAREAFNGQYHSDLCQIGFDEHTWTAAVEDGARLRDPKGATFDGRISEVLGRFARMFYPWSPKK